jgi:hypothetical protein
LTRSRQLFLVLALAFMFLIGRMAGIPEASPHRLSGKPKTLEAKLDLARRQVAHDRRALASTRTRHWALVSPLPFAAWSHRYWLRLDLVYVAKLTRLLNPYWAVDSCLRDLIWRESRWYVQATNPITGAYGLPQALPGSKMASAGADWRTNPWTQIRWMVGYVNGRYGGSCNALAFQRANGWY